MVVKVYISGISGNKEVKKRQQRVLMILESKSIPYEVIDITEPGREADKDFMQANATENGGTIGDPSPRHPLPPQIFNDDEYCGDYDKFDISNEVDTLEQFLKVPVPPQDIEGEKVEESEKPLNGTADLEKIKTDEIEEKNGDSEKLDTKEIPQETELKENTSLSKDGSPAKEEFETKNNVSENEESAEKKILPIKDQLKNNESSTAMEDTSLNDDVKKEIPGSENIPAIEEKSSNEGETVTGEIISTKASFPVSDPSSKEGTPKREQTSPKKDTSSNKECTPSKEGTPLSDIVKNEAIIKENSDTESQESVLEEQTEPDNKAITIANNTEETKEKMESSSMEEGADKQEASIEKTNTSDTEGQIQAKISETFIENEKSTANE